MFIFRIRHAFSEGVSGASECWHCTLPPESVSGRHTPSRCDACSSPMPLPSTRERQRAYAAVWGARNATIRACPLPPSDRSLRPSDRTPRAGRRRHVRFVPSCARLCPNVRFVPTWSGLFQLVPTCRGSGNGSTLEMTLQQLLIFTPTDPRARAREPAGCVRRPRSLRPRRSRPRPRPSQPRAARGARPASRTRRGTSWSGRPKS